MQVYTIEDLQKFKKDNDDYIICPSGDYTAIKDFPSKCSFGRGCRFGRGCNFGELCDFGKWCRFGEHCSFGEGCRFGEWCSFGEHCSFGEGCRFGEGCSFGECCSFGEWCRFGEHCSFGEWCSFGECCSFGERCKCENGHEFSKLFTVGYIGSRKATTQFWHLTDGSILVRCGCFCGLLDEFAAKVRKTHGDNRYAKEYMAAIELARVKFGVVTDEN